MAPLGFIEILDGRGNVDERVTVDSLPIYLGRAYGNQVVINDPYVSPIHASIESDEQGRLVARDLDSVNGLHSGVNKRRIASLELHSGTQFRIGRTQLRYCSIDHPLAPTLIDREHQYISAHAPYVAILGGLVVFLLLTLDSYLGTVERITFAKIVSEPLTTLSMLLVWSGLWSLASRIVVSRVYFPQHATIAFGAVLAFVSLSAASEWIEFVLPIIPALWIAGIFGLGVILAAMVYGHLGFASTMRSRSRLWASLMVSVAAMGLSVVIDYAGRSRFSNVMEYTGIVKPLDAAWLPATSIDQFVENGDKLKKELDTLAQKARATQP